MGTIVTRKRKDGTPSYTAQIRVKRGGVVIYSEAETFSRLREAKDWQAAREAALKGPGALKQATAKNVTIGEIIKRYCEEVGAIHPFGRTKLSHLRFLEGTALATKDALRLTPDTLVAHVRERRLAGTGPASAGNDLLWVRVVFKYARLAWGLPLPLDTIDAAKTLARSAGLIARAKRRKRRVSDKEINAVLKHMPEGDLPMADITLFALHSGRRQAEITRIRWDDLSPATHTGLIRDVKHPTKKKGNHKTCKFPPNAWEIILRQPRSVVAEGAATTQSALVFPYNPKTIGTYFTRAVHLAGVEDLHFHDLRHECVSRLFERGFTIPQVQLITLHDSWEELKGYAALRPEDVPDR